MRKATKATAFKFLRNNHTAVVATVDMQMNVSTTPVTFIVTNDRKLRFVTGDKSTKYKDILVNNKIALSVVDSKDTTSVNIAGAATVVYDNDEIKKTLKAVDSLRMDDEIPPVIKLNHGDYVVVELDPSRMQYTSFSSKSDELSEYVYNL